MRLERVTIQGFGPIAAYDAHLEPKRLNLIIGPNEAGKSSFANAILATLFGIPTLEAEEMARPWSGAGHATALVFSAGTGRFLLRRNFQTHEIVVEQLGPEGSDSKSTLFHATTNPRGKTPELSQYDELLRGWLGFTEARLFRESSFVYESSLETNVSPELRHIVSGAVEADYQQIQDALLDRLDQLTREHPYDPRQKKRNNRSIENREEKIEQLKARRTRSEGVLTEVKSRTKERDDLESRLHGLRGELAGKEQLLHDIEVWTAVREETKKLMKRGTAVGQELVVARKARSQAEEIDRKIAESLGYLANAPEEVEPDLLRLGMLRTQRTRHQKTLETDRTKFEGRSANPAVLVALAAAGVVVGAGVTYALVRNLLYGGLAAVIGGTLGLVVGRLLGQSVSKQRAMSEAQLRVAEENVRTLSAEIDQIEIRVNPYTAGRTLEVVLSDVKRFRAANQDRREAMAVIQSLPTPDRLEAEARELEEAIQTLRAKERTILSHSPLLAPLKDDPVQAAEAAERLKREAAGLRSKVEITQESLDKMLRRTGGSDGDAENLEILDDQIVAEETELKAEQRQRDALLLALDVLRDSVIAYQQQHVGRLAEAAGATLSKLTGGRYKSVTLDADFNPLLSTDGRKSVPLEALSRGARDAFYFSLRSALAKELAAREPLPLILDDPIAHLDEERRGTLLAMLEDLAKEIQVILLTHDRRV
ncbi:MAG TPA: AAA family ATPase, partial [Candidatus Eisenbacteria bacterium]|nr:AAA family ATPase [Candidatus Eisenbacteria bacterium]